MKTEDRTLIERALRAAIKQGFDPYNSHAVQSKVWEDKWARRERYRAEREAKLATRWLSI
jgi:hypothetical protein